MNRSDQFLSTRQVAEAIGVSESSVKRWVDDGALDAQRTAGGHRRIPLPAAVRFIREQRIRPENPHLLSSDKAPALGPVDDASAEALHAALLKDNVSAAHAIITGRFLAGASIASIGDGLIKPVLERLGELWLTDPRGILLEHRAVQTSIQALAELAGWLPPPPKNAPLAITAAGPRDPYTLPPTLATLTLRECGLRPCNLGPFTPLPTIDLALDQYGATLCAISISARPEPADATAWKSLLSSAISGQRRLVLGGRCVDSIRAWCAPGAQVAGSMTELAAYARGLFEGATRARPAKRPPLGA